MIWAAIAAAAFAYAAWRLLAPDPPRRASPGPPAVPVGAGDPTSVPEAARRLLRLSDRFLLGVGAAGALLGFGVGMLLARTVLVGAIFGFVGYHAARLLVESAGVRQLAALRRAAVDFVALLADGVNQGLTARDAFERAATRCGDPLRDRFRVARAEARFTSAAAALRRFGRSEFLPALELGARFLELHQQRGNGAPAFRELQWLLRERDKILADKRAKVSLYQTYLLAFAALIPIAMLVERIWLPQVWHTLTATTIGQGVAIAGSLIFVWIFFQLRRYVVYLEAEG